MFRFLLGFIYVLYILIESSKSSSVLASFNETCSENILCANPLICSNTNHCICSKSSSIWNNNLNDCLYCPPGWIAWDYNQCLSFSVPSKGGLSYEQANQTCLSFSSQLLNIYNIDELEQFQSKVDILLHSAFSSAITLFFRLGAWMDKYLVFDRLEDHWCDENEVDSTFECVYIRRNSLKNNSLCLSRLQCDEQMPFICDMTAISEKYTIENDNSESGNQRFAQLIAEFAPLALNLLGNLLGTSQQPQAQPQTQSQPQQIIIQQDPAAASQAASSDNTILIIGLVIGGFFLLLLICGSAGALIYFTGCLKNPSSTNERSSVDSTLSYG